jgi:hypothetical protein
MWRKFTDWENLFWNRIGVPLSWTNIFKKVEQGILMKLLLLTLIIVCWLEAARPYILHYLKHPYG